MICSITHRCNLRCKGCYARALHPLGKEEMGEARLCRLFDWGQ
jgi:MoaA/NifB/PqqE/SkfB family radical SAM enzyme